jgi:hypothetical protein
LTYGGVFDLQGLDESAVLSAVEAEAITIDIDFSAFDDIDSLL